MKFIESDPLLNPYQDVIQRRFEKIRATENLLTRGRMSLPGFAAGHEYFGLHYRESEWVFREWAPNAVAVYFIGDMTGWQEKKTFALERIDPEGTWEIRLSSGAMSHGDLYRLRIYWPGGGHGDRIPAYARRAVQDPETLIFNAQVWRPAASYRWKQGAVAGADGPPFIYEAHVGMAQNEEKIGSYQEFGARVLPRIISAGYNTIQLMGLQEHPYYGSFGYHVSNFFAASSRFGTPEDLKELIDTAHLAGIRVIMDLVHSHAVSNEAEGLSLFDGTSYQYFHAGPRGYHPAWGSRCFDFGKHQVLHFLLSNCRYWLDEFRVDGFRFDGVTSMLYHHHGLGRAFTSYQDYFDDSVDEDALTYLALANRLIHEVNPAAITVAEDVSGMPGLAVACARGGIGFDWRLAMGIPDYWIRLVKDTPDENWPMGHLWHELTNRRQDEKTISYTESHDQAIVGDQTLISRLAGDRIYQHMRVHDQDIRVDRAMALHKMIRLITLATAGGGYLNFMGNEFGHPEWIDFPRAGNQWSFRFARRQWNLADDAGLKYHFLARFDRDMLTLVQTCRILESGPRLMYEHAADKVLIFERQGLIFSFNFHPARSFTDYCFDAPPGEYAMVLDCDDPRYGGHGRLMPDQHHMTLSEAHGKSGRHFLSLYLPSRSALVLRRLD
ncbi:MAG: alpha amylase C-terminal domain-containing protein [Desulfobacterales bacterium]|nr:alpha amylase C-terminal domain-containing protein [Desulfobacterales bacterium]